jgi:hypothetical protein
MTIHAFTEPRSPLPAYINVSERVSDKRDVIVTVRSSGENETSMIILSRDQLRKLSEDIGKFLGAASEKIQPDVAPNPSPTGEQLYTMVTGRFKSGSLPWSYCADSGKAAWEAAAGDLQFASDTIMARYYIPSTGAL